MGGLPSHEAQAYETDDAPSDTDYRGSLRVLTGMLTRQNGAKKHRGKVLFLGLDGAGKSTLVNHLSRVSMGDELTLLLSTVGRELPAYLYPEPTRTQQTASYRDGGDRYLMLVDPPGRRAYRSKWYNTGSEFATFGGSSSNLNNATVANVANTFQTVLPVLAVVFVIDAADATRFPVVAAELVRFLKLREQNKTFRKAQLFLVLNKTDHFLPPPPPETSEEQEATDYQQVLNRHKQQQRAAIHQARRELRKCVDYELAMDQRRHPFIYRDPRASVASAVASKTWPGTPSFLFASAVPPAVADVAPVLKSSNEASAPIPGASSLFISVTDCCAQERESVRALRSWINEELKKAPSP